MQYWDGYFPILAAWGVMSVKNKIDVKAIVLQLLAEKSEISLRDVAQVSGLSKSNEGDRKAIRRVLNSLIERGFLAAKGAARARTYILTTQPSEEVTAGVFKNIQLSHESKALLHYVSQTLQERTPVGYNQDFLRSYEPNRTFYLSAPLRAELLTVGQIENRVRPAGTYARTILNRLLIDLSWNSSRLEGNTYSLLETKRLLELGENAIGKNLTDAQMILNHKAAIEYIFESVEEEMSSHKVRSIHALLSENLLGDTSASGRVRQITVGVSGSTYMPLENPHALIDCFQIFIQKLNVIEDPFEQSFFSLVQLSYLQVFEDVNKRTARLVANIPLIRKNLKPLSFVDVDRDANTSALLGVYEKTDISLLRDLYTWAYKRSSQQYSAIQQATGEPNQLKLQYRIVIQNIIRAIVLEKIAGQHVVAKIQTLIKSQNLPETVTNELFNVIETEILNLHDGNIARFRIRPSEFQEWRNIQ